MMGQKWRSLLLILGLGGLMISLPANTYLTSLNSPESTIYQTAINITVKILSDTQTIGSGILIKQQGEHYIVITNAHVLDAANAPYRIQTHDNQVYNASIASDNLGNHDLALLKFQSPKTYSMAQLGTSKDLQKGETVYAAGFPILETNIPAENISFTLKSGTVTEFLDKPLEGGYQLGMTTDVTKGMSGGALLNAQGEVIAVNGKHAYPLWEAPDYYEDGSQVPTSVQQSVNETSWAIPVEKIVLD